MGQYRHMQKLLTLVFQLFVAGMVLLGMAPAQQTPATPAQSSQPASQPASGQASGQGAAPAKKPATTVKKAPVRSATALTLKTQKEKASYALGMRIGADLRKQGAGDAVDPAIA